MKTIPEIFNRSKVLIVLYVYMLLILLIFGLFFVPEKKFLLKELINFSLVAGILFSFSFLFNFKQMRQILIWSSAILLALILIIKLSFYYHYQSPVTASAFFIVFETYTKEYTSFLDQYIDKTIVFLIVLILLPFVVSIFLKPIRKAFSGVYGLKFNSLQRVIFGLVIVCFSVLISKRFYQQNLVILGNNAFKDYKVYKENIKSELSKSTNAFIKDAKQIVEKQTHIIVIGESTTRRNMQLYGYNRATNPLLSEIENELLVYTNVISPNTHTLAALDKILTASDYQNPQRKENHSVVQLANSAGYKTYWISNQQPIGFYESMPSIIASAANERYFLNHKHGDEQGYDGVLLPKLKEILNDDEEKRVIFIHLLGTHVDYDNKYPESFNYFKDGNYTAKNKTEEAKYLVNAYDNAVRYNDFVIRQMIDVLKSKQINSSFLYFSDHGEDVYLSNPEITGHDEYHGTKPMYQIPFILWLSEKNSFGHRFKKIEFDSILNRPYMMDDFVHSFSDLTGVKYADYQSKKSIFNSDFEPKPRLIKDNIDYDKE